jgi:hypothetical protein
MEGQGKCRQAVKEGTSLLERDTEVAFLRTQPHGCRLHHLLRVCPHQVTSDGWDCAHWRKGSERDSESQALVLGPDGQEPRPLQVPIGRDQETEAGNVHSADRA